MKNNKSLGNAGITGEMIKSGGNIMIKEINKICNTAWREGCILDKRKKSILVILHKKVNALEQLH